MNNARKSFHPLSTDSDQVHKNTVNKSFCNYRINQDNKNRKR